MTARISNVIFQPSLNIYFGDRPYPTGIALMDVGSMYERFTPTDATYMYGIGLSPQPCVMDITSGMATAAVAVLDVTSDMRSVTASITNTVINPPFISSFDIHSAQRLCSTGFVDECSGSKSTGKYIHKSPDDLTLNILPHHDTLSVLVGENE